MIESLDLRLDVTASREIYISSCVRSESELGFRIRFQSVKTLLNELVPLALLNLNHAY